MFRKQNKYMNIDFPKEINTLKTENYFLYEVGIKRKLLILRVMKLMIYILYVQYLHKPFN